MKDLVFNCRLLWTTGECTSNVKIFKTNKLASFEKFVNTNVKVAPLFTQMRLMLWPTLLSLFMVRLYHNESPVENGDRVIIVHAESKDGFIPSPVLQWKGSQNQVIITKTWINRIMKSGLSTSYHLIYSKTIRTHILIFTISYHNVKKPNIKLNKGKNEGVAYRNRHPVSGWY